MDKREGGSIVAEFTVKERRFIDEYMVDLNATQAAIRSKYSKNSARQIGTENLSKPSIKAEIEKRLKALQLDAEGTKSIVSKIAKSNVNKYLKTVRVKQETIIQRHLSEFIKDIEKEISFEDEYAKLADLTKDELKKHAAGQKGRHRQIIRLKLELKDNPDATRGYPGEPEEVDRTEFDLVALAKDKENGIIKSFKMTKDGPQVEFCSIDGQLANLLRIHGQFSDSLELTTKGSVDPDKWLQQNSTPTPEAGE